MASKDVSRESEKQIVLDATRESIARTRWVLVVISTLIILGFFRLFLWYGSWDLARVEAFRTMADQLAKGKVVDVQTQVRIDAYRAEASAVERRIRDERIEFAPLGLNVSATDFPTALMLAGLSAQAWLYFFQRRVRSCLLKLREYAGARTLRPLLAYHFTLIQRESGLGKTLVFALFVGLPALAWSFLVSDLVDCVQLHVDDRALALNSGKYVLRLVVRFILDIAIAAVMSILARDSLRAFRETEQQLLEGG